MLHVTPHFKRLKTPYVFPIIEEKLARFEKENPGKKVLNLGIGDVCLPLAPSVAKAITDATQEMTERAQGYGPCGGFAFLKEAVCQNEYDSYGLTPEEIFISDGANTDASAILELFDEKTIVAVTDPTYPVYRDATLLSGKELLTLPLLEEESFIPKPPKERADIAYLCTPCNPTGVAMTRANLTEWISWAKKNKSLLIIDNVYNAFAQDDDVPDSIYELEGAREVAIEIRSFSKWAGFTGLRCGTMVIPHALHCSGLSTLWQKRIDIKTNGVSYPIQRGAACCYDPSVKKELTAQVATYQNSARMILESLKAGPLPHFGGVNAPYIWIKTPQGVSSWDFFDQLLNKSQILAIPGSGFGPGGEGYIRLSCFLSNPLAHEAARALQHQFTTA